jgi:hypothetical protein
VSYENDALVVAEQPRLGIVSWSRSDPGRDLPQQLRYSVELRTPPEVTDVGIPWSWHPVHGVVNGADLPPFAPGTTDFHHPLSLPIFEPALPQAGGPVRRALEVRAALYLIARNAEPTWWQLTLRYGNIVAEQLARRTVRHLRWEPCLYSRPVVSIRFLDDDEGIEFNP